MSTTHAQHHDLEAESAAIDRLLQHLRHDLPAASSEEITDAVDVEYRRFERSPIRDFIPILIERRVRDRFRAANSTRGYRPPSAG